MNNFISELLSDNYKIVETESWTEIYYFDKESGIGNQEICVQYRETPACITVLVKNRDNANNYGLFDNKDFAFSLIYVLCKRMFESLPDNPAFKKELRKASQQEAIELISKMCDPRYFSVNKIKKNAINLIAHNDSYEICYLGISNEKITIVEGANYERAIVIVYNYAILLQEFNNIFKIIIDVFPNINNDFELLFQYYIGK